MILTYLPEGRVTFIKWQLYVDGVILPLAVSRTVVIYNPRLQCGVRYSLPEGRGTCVVFREGADQVVEPPFFKSKRRLDGEGDQPWRLWRF